MKKIEVNSIKPIKQFISEIDELVKNTNVDYIDAVIYYCEKNNVEIEVAASLIKSSSTIKARIQNEAEQLNFLPKSAKLPF